MPELALSDKAVCTDSSALVLGTHITREMVNLPANQMTPAGIEQAAHEIAQACSARFSVVSGEAFETLCTCLAYCWPGRGDRPTHDRTAMGQTAAL